MRTDWEEKICCKCDKNLMFDEKLFCNEDTGEYMCVDCMLKMQAKDNKVKMLIMITTIVVFSVIGALVA